MSHVHIPWYKYVIRRIKRYGIGEIFATWWALLWGYIITRWTDSSVAIGYAWARWENICYYWYFLYKEYRDQALFHGKKISIWTVFVGMISEFWPWEVLDSLIIKPFLMWWWSKTLWTLGFIVGKYLADSIYYTLATLLYHHKTKKRINESLYHLEKRISKFTEHNIR